MVACSEGLVLQIWLDKLEVISMNEYIILTYIHTYIHTYTYTNTNTHCKQDRLVVACSEGLVLQVWLDKLEVISTKEYLAKAKGLTVCSALYTSACVDTR